MLKNMWNDIKKNTLVYFFFMMFLVIFLIGAVCATAEVYHQEKTRSASKDDPMITFEGQFEVFNIEGSKMQYIVHKQTGEVFLRSGQSITEIEWPDGKNFTRDDLLSSEKQKGARNDGLREDR